MIPRIFLRINCDMEKATHLIGVLWIVCSVKGVIRVERLKCPVNAADEYYNLCVNRGCARI